MGLEVTNTVLLSAAEVEIQAAGSWPSVSIVAYTGGVMSVPGWGPGRGREGR